MFDPNNQQSPFMTTPTVSAGTEDSQNQNQNQAQDQSQATGSSQFFSDNQMPPQNQNPFSSDANTAASYVDSYQPPQQNQPDMSMTPVSPAEPDFSTASAVIANSPVASDSAAAPTPAPAMNSTDSVVSQSLEDQNIFFLLGAQDGTDEEKEAFLDELQQVIWEDFLENDVELLITEEEKLDLDKIMARKDLDEAAMQEEIVVFLEKLVPDLEEIMLEKALELKEDMVRERIAGMREYYAGKDAQLAVLSEAETLINENSWRDAAQKLNSLQDQDQSQSTNSDPA